MLRARCPGGIWGCIERIIGSPSVSKCDGTPEETILNEIEKRRSNFNRAPLYIFGFHEADRNLDERYEPTLRQALRETRWRLIFTMPLHHLSVAVNATMETYRADYCTTGWIAFLYNVMHTKHKERNRPSCALIFDRHDQSVLLYSGETYRHNPLTLRSLRLPFDTLLGLLCVLLAILTILVATKMTKAKLAHVAIAFVSPIMAQISNFGAVKTARFWTASWMVATTSGISSVYLCALQSYQVVPSVETSKMTLEEMVRQNFSFYTTPEWFDQYKGDLAILKDYRASRSEMSVSWSSI